MTVYIASIVVKETMSRNIEDDDVEEENRLKDISYDAETRT